MNEIRDIRDIVVIIRDIALTIAAVLLVISMVHYDKYGAGLHLGLSISNDSNAKQYGSRDGFVVYSGGGKLQTDIRSIQDSISVYHSNSCFRN